MAYSHGNGATAVVQEPPVVCDLRNVFASLDDAPLLAALRGPARVGRKGHPVEILWRCFVAKYRMGLASTDALIRALYDNPYLANVCGIPTPDASPHKSTFSRFFAKLADGRHAHLVKNVSRAIVRANYAKIPAFGQRVAMDSTTLKAWSNGGPRIHSDSQAGWAAKTGTHGKTEFTFGYKLHLIVDCESEMPIAANVTAGNVNDYKAASRVLAEARTSRQFHPAFIMADKGYSGQSLVTLIHRQYRSTPIIDLNKSHLRLARRSPKTRTPTEFVALYRQRTAVERVFSRLKGQRSLNSIRVRGLRKVVVHCYLALIAMQV